MAEWRAGRSTGRTLWRDEQLVGLVDSPEVAAEIVETMNRGERLLVEVERQTGRKRSLATGGVIRDGRPFLVGERSPRPGVAWACCGSTAFVHPLDRCPEAEPGDAQRRSEATPKNDLLDASRVDPYDTTKGGITE